MQENLRTRHRAEPVHTKSQIIQLKDKFKEKIRVFPVGEEADNTLGGLVFFNTTNVFHLQYMAVDLVGKSKSLGDFLITRVMETAMRENYDFFAFGHSNENFGRDLNVGLLSFKEKFGSELSDAIWWRKNLGGDS